MCTLLFAPADDSWKLSQNICVVSENFSQNAFYVFNVDFALEDDSSFFQQTLSGAASGVEGLFLGTSAVRYALAFDRVLEEFWN